VDDPEAVCATIVIVQRPAWTLEPFTRPLIHTAFAPASAPDRPERIE
jgi:hypothetical protein